MLRLIQQVFLAAPESELESTTDLCEITCFANKCEKYQVNLLRKEVIHRQLPLPMPCYDFTPVMSLTLNLKEVFGYYPLPWCDGRCVQNPRTYSP